MGKKAANKPKSQTKNQQQRQHQGRNKRKQGRVNKKKTRHEVVKVRLSPGTSNMALANPQAKKNDYKKLRPLLQRNFQKVKDDRIKTPKRLKALPKTKRKLDFKTDRRSPSPMKPLRNLPKPKFYRPSEICRSSNNLNDTIEDGEIVEELDSSCDDDCVILDPSLISIDLDDNSQEVHGKLDDNANEKMENNVDKLHFLEDNKRNAQLLLKAKTENGLLYSTLSMIHKPKISNDDDNIIIIDDSFDVPKTSALLNDSVIILEDYIPLSTVEPPTPEPKPVKKRDPIKKQSRMNDSLFTMSERKKLCVYNSNTFNPTVDEPQMNNDKETAPPNHKRSIVIDGSNVAFGHGKSNVFSAEGIKYCLQYFEKMGHTVKAVMPLFRKNPTKSSNPELLDRLYKEGKIVFTPCKNLPGQMSSSYDDRFILQIAYEWNAAIVSNDNYRDLINENVAFKKIIENRVIGYSWCDNMFILAKDPYGRWGPQLDEILRC